MQDLSFRHYHECFTLVENSPKPSVSQRVYFRSCSNAVKLLSLTKVITICVTRVWLQVATNDWEHRRSGRGKAAIAVSCFITATGECWSCSKVKCHCWGMLAALYHDGRASPGELHFWWNLTSSYLMKPYISWFYSLWNGISGRNLI